MSSNRVVKSAVDDHHVAAVTAVAFVAHLGNVLILDLCHRVLAEPHPFCHVVKPDDSLLCPRAEALGRKIVSVTLLAEPCLRV